MALAGTRQYTVTASANGVYGFNSRWIDTRGHTLVTVFVNTAGGTSVDARIVGTASPASASNVPSTSSPGFEALSFRTPGNAAYTTTAVTINGDASETFHLDPSDMMPFIGIQLTNMSGTVNVTATVYLS